MTTKLNVLVIGASGNWGAPLMDAFVQRRDSFARLAILARDQAHGSKFKERVAQGIELVYGSFLDKNVYTGFDVVLSLVGNDLLRLQPAMVQAASQGGVTQFYPSEWGVDLDQDAVSDKRYFRDKMATRAECHSTAKTNPNFKYTIFLNGFLTEWALIAGFEHEKRTAVVYGSPDARVGSTSTPDIARATVESILIPLRDDSSYYPGRRTIRIQGGSKPVKDLIKDLETARGGEPYHVEYRDAREADAKMHEARAKGDEPGEMWWSLITMLGNGHTFADGVPGAKLNNDLFSPPAFETQAETLKRVWGGK